MKKNLGNEKEVLKFLYNHKNRLFQNPIGLLKKLEIPFGDLKHEINHLNDIDKYYSDDAHKKADCFINNLGVSIKQEGPANLFNRLQRKNIIPFFKNLIGVKNSLIIQKKLDDLVLQFHDEKIKRNVDIYSVFDENDLKKILKQLMLVGSPNLGISNFPAQIILIAPKTIGNMEDVKLYNFNNFFEEYKDSINLAIRRSWIGQNSESEHKRALTISKDINNAPWVFNKVVGEPKTNKKRPNKWRDDIPESERKTVYYIMIDLKK